MKRPIQWHEDCLKNFEASLERAREESILAQMKVVRMSAEASFRRQQILKAKKKNMEEFDGERFMENERPTPTDQQLRDVVNGPGRTP